MLAEKNIHRIKNYITQAHWEKALTAIKDTVEDIIWNPFCNGIILHCPHLDEFCQQIGNATNDNILNSKITTANTLFIASQLYTSGGHTAVMEDLIRHNSQVENHILITNIYNNHQHKKIISRFKNLAVTIHWCRAKSLLAKLEWLRSKWLELNPSATYLFNHHQDATIIAAATPQMPGKIFYYHHLDFQCGLGKSLRHTIHIDCNPLAFDDCKARYHHQNIYLPLSSPDHGLRAQNPSSFMPNGTLHTASSGALNKFTWPYPYSYIELLPQIIKTTQGKHTHIGKLDHASFYQLKTLLKQYGIKSDQFQYIPFTTNLWRTLQEQKIDLLLTSFPVGGGRTAVEVIGSGTPILTHTNEISPFLSEQAMLYSQALRWSHPIELFKILRTMTPIQLAYHSVLGRDHYEKYHTDTQLRQQLRGNFTDQSSRLPNQIYSTLPVQLDQKSLIAISEYMMQGKHLATRGLPRIIKYKIKFCLTIIGGVLWKLYSQIISCISHIGL